MLYAGAGPGAARDGRRRGGGVSPAPPSWAKKYRLGGTPMSRLNMVVKAAGLS